MHYAAGNSYASDTSVGFCNTWSAIGFPSRKARDAYVAKATDLATKAIKVAELALIGEKRGRVSYYTADGVLMQYCGMNDGVAQFIAMPSADEIGAYWATA